jgi:hypothetical protein
MAACKRGCNAPNRDGAEVRYEVGDDIDLTVHSKKTINALVKAGCVDKPGEDS